ncbi:MAG: sugar transferase [Cyanobacterium sp. T60_A2020_053]|nr:sugar transferase [Cyanobacterium sp. T60_A2020_053]
MGIMMMNKKALHNKKTFMHKITSFTLLFDNSFFIQPKKVIFKRIFDIVFSLLILITFSPLYLLLSVIVAFSSQGEIFFAQKRVGKNFRPFFCIKFRTMVANADKILDNLLKKCPQTRKEFQANFKLKNDPRITRIGLFLRRTSLDEFPQFWNVFKGEMSIVGPRPLVIEEIPMYGNKINQVLKVKPGITGLWQVSGRNNIPYKKRICIDVYYSQNHNFWLDLSIILKTIWVIIFVKDNGAY